MRALFFALSLVIYSHCFGGGGSSTSFVTATDSNGNTVAVWLDTSLNYYYSTCSNGGSFVTPAPISSITSSGILSDLVAIAYDNTHNAFLILLQTDKNIITYTYLTGLTTFSTPQTTTIPADQIYDILAKYSSGGDEFLVMINSYGGTGGSSPIFWSTSTYNNSLTSPSSISSPHPDELTFDFDNQGNALAAWTSPGLGGTLKESVIYYSFKPVNGNFGDVSAFTPSTAIGGSAALVNWLKYSNAKFLKGLTPMAESTMGATYQYLNVISTDNPNAPWIFLFLLSDSLTQNIGVLIANDKGIIVTPKPITLLTFKNTPKNITYIDTLLSAKLTPNQLIFSYNTDIHHNTKSFYATYNITNLLNKSPSNFFNPVTVASGYSNRTLSVLNGVAFLSYFFDTTVGWSTVSGGIFSPQASLTITSSGLYYTANPIQTSPTVSALFVWLDSNGSLYSLQQP